MRLQRPFEAITPTLDGDILYVLGRAEAAFTGGDLDRLIPHATGEGIRKAAKRLVAQGLVHMEVVGQSHRYSLNREHLLADPVVAMARARDQLVDRTAETIEEWTDPPQVVILFGSGARGEMRPESDLDLFVVSEGTQSQEGALAELAERMTAWTGNDVRILNMHPDEVVQGVRNGDPVLAGIEADGLVLWGPERYLQAVRLQSVPNS